MHKAQHDVVTREFLRERLCRAVAQGYGKAKWISFCQALMRRGLTIHLYEARKTCSKYLTVSQGDESFKVRFSNHAPILAKELEGDCDFFVGVTNLRTTTALNALSATLKHFGIT